MSDRSGLAARVVGAWRDPAGSWRAEWRADPPEARLLAIAFGASVFLTLGPLAAETIRPELATGEERTPWFAARLLIGLSFLPLSLYAIAALIGIVSRLCGGETAAGGSRWKAVRLAFFWSAFASGPFAALSHAVAAAAGAAAAGSLTAGLMWLGLFVPMLAAAQGFRTLRVALVFASVAASVFLLAVLGVS